MGTVTLGSVTSYNLLLPGQALGDWPLQGGRQGGHLLTSGIFFKLSRQSGGILRQEVQEKELETGRTKPRVWIPALTRVLSDLELWNLGENTGFP